MPNDNAVGGIVIESMGSKRVRLWSDFDPRQLKQLCVLMFVMFIAVLAIGQVIAQTVDVGLDPLFYVLSGFCLGVSEMLYWLYKGLA